MIIIDFLHQKSITITAILNNFDLLNYQTSCRKYCYPFDSLNIVCIGLINLDMHNSLMVYQKLVDKISSRLAIYPSEWRAYFQTNTLEVV